MKPQISIFMSGIRPQFWQRMYDSTLFNKINLEFVVVGPNPPAFKLPSNFKFFQSGPNIKPSQCYEAASRNCEGELIGWGCDDGDYNDPTLACPLALDIIWNKYQESQNKYDDNKTILSQRTIEDGSDISDRHHFFHGKKDTPLMAPLGFINREWFVRLGGYDRNFVCGQSENDIVMRGISDGGRVELVTESKIFIHHSQCHGSYPFRHGYKGDREYLEKCWVNEGYGTYERRVGYTLSSTRLFPLQPFEDKDILTVNQGPVGEWGQRR